MCDVKEKFCKGCETIKPLDEFGVQKLGKYGRRSKCHICRRSEVNAKRNTDEGKAHRKAYRHRNRDKVNAQKREKRANDPEAREKDNARKRAKEYRDRANVLRSTAEAKAKRSTYKKSDIGKKLSLESKHRIRDRFINSLIDSLVERDVSIDNPYIFYHFKIGDIYKFGITKYGVEHRYCRECNIESIKDLRQYVLGERDARDIEKIVFHKTKDSRFYGDSPFWHTGITELRTTDSTELIESLINELNFKLIKV